MAAEIYFYTLQRHRNIFYKPSPGTQLFLMFTVLHGLFPLVLIFPGLSTPPSTVQGKCINTIFKAENQEINFPLLCTKPSIDKYFKKIFQRLVVPESIYRPVVPSMCYQFGGFIGQPFTIVEWRGPIYRPNVPIRQDFCADLSADRSQRVNSVHYAQVFQSICQLWLHRDLRWRWGTTG